MSREQAWDAQIVTAAPDGRFSFSDLPLEPMSLSTNIKGYHPSPKNRSLDPIMPARLIGTVQKDVDDLLFLVDPGPLPRLDYRRLNREIHAERRQRQAGSLRVRRSRTRPAGECGPMAVSRENSPGHASPTSADFRSMIAGPRHRFVQCKAGAGALRTKFCFERPGQHGATWRRRTDNRLALDTGRLLGACGQGSADVIELRGGGEIQGKVITDPAKPDTVQVLLLKGKNPLTFQRKQILKVTPKVSPLDQYLVKKQQLSATAPAEYELGLWCEQHGLTDLARAHYEAAVAQDRMFEPAHKKLGHVQHGSQWFSPDELRQMQGLVKYKGRWVTEEARAKGEESAQLSATQSTWVRRIKMLRQAMVAGADDRRREAEAEMMQIHEVEAVYPLVKVLGGDTMAMRTILAHVLAAIPGKESNQALVDMLLAEPEDEVRHVVLDKVREHQEPGTVPQLVKALRSENVRVVNRAGWALGNLGAMAAVPALVAALLTTEERIEFPTSDSAGQAAIPGAQRRTQPRAHGHESQLAGLPDTAGRGARGRGLWRVYHALLL